mmetsp:Transcript_30369/g.48735  ORF Transcript_30369/g.48735 Transcript_30369/m.48735 type:complete len:135 (-) Transcript_30369:1292-1696(-)
MAICLMAVAEALTRLDYHCFRGHCFSSLLYRGYWKLTKHVHNDSILIITLLDMGLGGDSVLGEISINQKCRHLIPLHQYILLQSSKQPVSAISSIYHRLHIPSLLSSLSSSSSSSSSSLTACSIESWRKIKLRV